MKIPARLEGRPHFWVSVGMAVVLLFSTVTPASAINYLDSIIRSHARK